MKAVSWRRGDVIDEDVRAAPRLSAWAAALLKLVEETLEDMIEEELVTLLEDTDAERELVVDAHQFT